MLVIIEHKLLLNNGRYSSVLTLFHLSHLFKPAYLSLYITAFMCAFAPLTSVAMNNNGHASNESTKPENRLVKTNLHEKYYQQALYYYFQQDYSRALNIISQSKLRLGSLDQTSQLFEAGLQIKLGLQEQARLNLLSLTERLQTEKTILRDPPELNKQANQKDYKANIEQLLVLALLSLSEQYIEQGYLVQAQQTLGKITKITPRYYQQYHVLSQLAYWSEVPSLVKPTMLQLTGNVQKVLNVKGSETELEAIVKHTPYIHLNKALRFIEKENFKQAITLLNIIKNIGVQTNELSFFQALFTPDSTIDNSIGNVKESSRLLENKKLATLNNQAINDYARLLLAYLYVEQEAYEQAYLELKSFPDLSPYTESALFLFAFSAQKINQHTTALSLLTLLHEQYPYSPLGWQASLLMAQQATVNKGLIQGWQVYQNVETFFLDKIDSLNDFEQSFSEKIDLLSSSENAQVDEKAKDNRFIAAYLASLKSKDVPYASESPWLIQAKNNVALSHSYQQLQEVTELYEQGELLEQKSHWIVDVITLNQERKSRIAATQQGFYQQRRLENILAKQKAVSDVLVSALHDPQQKGTTFANKEEQVWLARLKQSKESLAYIIDHSEPNQQSNNKEYQARLERLNAVLMWQLNQKFPQRFWQHKQQLTMLDNSVQRVTKLQENVSFLVTESTKIEGDSSLLPFIRRQKIEDKKIKPLMDNAAQLQVKLTSSIRTQVAYYIDERRSLLKQHLLSTRKAMAAVLEKMSLNDKKRERQLNIDQLDDSTGVFLEDVSLKETRLKEIVKEVI